MLKEITQARVTKEFLDEQIKKGCMFLYEKYLDALPDDWFDTVMFIATEGMGKKDKYFVILDDKMSEKINSLLASEKIRVWVFSQEKQVVWDVLLVPQEVKDEKKCLWIGGENLRKFCDERNIFYKSVLTSDGKLMSGSNLKFQKNEGEDCRIPVAQGLT